MSRDTVTFIAFIVLIALLFALTIFFSGISSAQKTQLAILTDEVSKLRTSMIDVQTDKEVLKEKVLAMEDVVYTSVYTKIKKDVYKKGGDN